MKHNVFFPLVENDYSDSDEKIKLHNKRMAKIGFTMMSEFMKNISSLDSNTLIFPIPDYPTEDGQAQKLLAQIMDTLSDISYYILCVENTTWTLSEKDLEIKEVLQYWEKD